MAAVTVPHIRHRVVEIDGVRVFYRETGPTGAPALLLLHGFPRHRTSSVGSWTHWAGDTG